LLGDGSINVKSSRVFVTLNKNEIKYAKHISNLVYRNFGINTKIKFRKKENTLDVFIFNRDFINFLTKMVGLIPAPKKNRALIPTRFLSKELGRFVLRGIFDRDGCITITNNNGTIYPTLEIKAAPSPMKESMIKLLDGYGFKFGVYDIEKCNIRIQMNGYSQLFKWLKLIGIKNPNQFEKIKMLIIAGHGFEPWTFPQKPAFN